jgi:hypothetical protein
MDLWKFLDLIQRKSLYFSLPSQQADPNEITYEGNQNPLPTDIFILNCWHKNTNENILMWKTYISGRDGVAIKVNLEKLSTHFKSVHNGFKIIEIEYVPKNSQAVLSKTDTGNIDLSKIIEIKTPEYSSENEVRVYILKANIGKGKFDTGEKMTALLESNGFTHEMIASAKVLLETHNSQVNKQLDEEIKDQIISPKGLHIPFDVNIIEEVILHPQISDSVRILLEDIKTTNGFTYEIKDSVVKEKIG